MSILNPEFPKPESQLAPFIRTTFFTGVFALNFFLAYKQAFAPGHYKSDLPAHIHLSSQGLGSAAVESHPGFHYLTYGISRVFGLSFEYAAIILVSVASLLTALFIHRILTTTLRGRGYTASGLLAITGVLITLAAIYLPFFNPNLYLGQGGANLWHNPTITVMKPLAFVAFLTMMAAFRRSGIRESWGFYLIAGLALAASVIVKPSFAMVFIPGVVILTLLQRRLGLLVKTIVTFVPCLLLLAMQYFAGFGAKALEAGTVTNQQPYGGDSIFFDFLGVWSGYTPSVSVSLLLGMAFPLAILAFRFRRVLENRALVLSWLMTLFGIAQFALLAERGRYRHGNFSWGFCIALSFLFVYSTIEYLGWLKPGHPRTRLERVALMIASVVLSLHVVSGSYYVIRILSGGSFL